MKIQIEQDKRGYHIPVRRDLSYLLNPDTVAWLTEKTGDDEDMSDEYKELEDC